MPQPNFNEYRSASRVSRPPRSFYARPALAVAPDLLGLHLVCNDGGVLRTGRIVETEAYMGPDDLAAHSAGGRRTARTEVMFGPPGHAYVYFIYGFWNCLNVVTSPAGVPHAVLLRAVEPVTNIASATWGPGLLCRALSVDRTLNGTDLRGDVLWIERPRQRRRDVRIGTGPRIGVEYAREWARRPWRFFDRDSSFLSSLSPAARRRAGIA
ncbi:MAG: DNA-3-methyladenine glycosylase [Steroidobacteraceae bacterium]